MRRHLIVATLFVAACGAPDSLRTETTVTPFVAESIGNTVCTLDAADGEGVVFAALADGVSARVEYGGEMLRLIARGGEADFTGDEVIYLVPDYPDFSVRVGFDDRTVDVRRGETVLGAAAFVGACP